MVYGHNQKFCQISALGKTQKLPKKQDLDSFSGIFFPPLVWMGR